MKRRKRTEILINTNENIVKFLAEQILNKYEVVTVEKPDYGMVMMKVRETSKKSLFYLGEVLVTECKVQIKGHIGIGIIKGHKDDMAFYLSVIDAAYNAKLEETKELEKILLLEETKQLKEYEQYKNRILKTKVNFETMNI
ncbi:phosphonate C-P lyase system protein PhnG [Herbivorax sp. ANBcel31]|uniref:phosphonate C-P lyase system protein PhnG n=1 Tax=Herbivorax sp. ANBcel31 TaxID=3069754 RepID=UPI0027B72428|nr:phosphonate C-P lyase system protein PhnG [Herbivorax sp. ANBcel31]MDQ2086750.1 phosphonate C-P lyase system protein PhnG [Herbivorax sp. ANBcel31]